MIIPAEITARHGVRQEDVFHRGGNADGISDAVFEFATVANDNLLTAREMFKQSGGDGGRVPRVAMPVFLYGVRSLFFASLLSSILQKPSLGFTRDTASDNTHSYMTGRREEGC